jgi:hypothetical protein
LFHNPKDHEQVKENQERDGHESRDRRFVQDNQPQRYQSDRKKRQYPNYKLGQIQFPFLEALCVPHQHQEGLMMLPEVTSVTAF